MSKAELGDFAIEIIEAQYVERATRKGWMTRGFYLNGVPYYWVFNVDIGDGDVARYGIRMI